MKLPGLAAAGVALLLLLFPPDGRSATLSGVVVDRQDRQPLHYTTVAIRGLSLGALSNESGYYAIRDIPPGTYVVAFSHVGYAIRQDTLTFAGSEQVRLDAALASESIVFEETVVTASPRQEERAVQSGFLEIPIGNIQRLPAAGEPDLLRSLQLLPGVQTASDISSGLYIRGGGPDQNLILLDQVPLYNPSHAFGFFSTFNPDAVKEVSLYKGAYPASYGGNLGAVLDVSNREGNRQQFGGRGGLSLISGRLLLEGPAGNGSWMLSGRRTYLEPVLSVVRAAGADLPGYYFYDTNGTFTQQLSERDAFTFSAFWSQDHLSYDSDRETFLDLRWGNRAFAGRLDRLFSSVLFGRLLVSGSQYESTSSASFFDTPVLLANGVRDLTLRANLDYTAGRGHLLSGGAVLTRYWFDYRQTFNQQQQIGLDQTPFISALYLQDEWQLDPLTSLRLGARASYFSQGNHWSVMPRFSLSRALQPGLRLKLGGGSYRQYLQLVTTEGFSGGDFWVPLDRTVGPSRSRQGVFGLDWEPGPRYKFTAEGYYSHLANLVVLDNNVAGDSDGSRSEDLFKTGGTGYAAGAEFFLEKRTGKVRGWIGYALGRTRRRFPELNGGRPFPPKYDRRHDLSLVLSYQRRAWNWGASFVYGTGQAFTPAAARYSLRVPATGDIEDYVLPADRNSARLLPYHRLDLSARRRLKLWGSQAEAYAQIFNVYSRRNEWFVQYNTDDPDTRPEIVRMLPIIPTFGIDFSF
jgi:hypothetical protein